MSQLIYPERKAKEKLGELLSGGVVHPLHKKGFLIDIDGVVCRGMELIKGADEVIRKLRENEKRTVFVSNNSTKSPRLYKGKMSELGIEVEEKDLVLATVVAADHIREKTPNASVYVVGDKGLGETMEEYGLETTEVPGESDYVVVGNPFRRDGRLRDGNDGKITGAVRAILENDAKFIAVNVDTIFPTENGPVPATGAIVKAIAHSTGHSPDIVAGKPEKPMISLALERLNLKPEECVLIGDSRVDMVAAQEYGLTSVFVRTGSAEERDLEEEGVFPDFALDSIRDLLVVENSS